MEKPLQFGLQRIKLELLFILSGGEKLEKSFTYDQQRNYYMKEIFGDTDNAREIIAYGKKYKLVSEYMFPNNPSRIRSFKLLIKAFAWQSLLSKMFAVNDYNDVIDEFFPRKICPEIYSFDDMENNEIIRREIEDLHSHFIKDFPPVDYKEFQNLMKKFSVPFKKVSDSIKICVTQEKDTVTISERKNFTGFERSKLDLIFVLAGGEKLDRNFTYDRQLDFYIKEIFGDTDKFQDIIIYGKQYKLASEYMFPNNPSNIDSRKFFFELFADTVFLNQIYLANSFDTFKDKMKIQENCFAEFTYDTIEGEEIFKNEIKLMQARYINAMGAEDYNTFVNLIEKFIEPLKKILKALHACASTKSPIKFPIKASVKTDVFSVLCRKLEISAESFIIFKLQLDALAEIQIGNNTYIDYFESLKNEWKEKFPRYDYCEEIEDYIKQEKFSCVVAFGNKLNSIRSENTLFGLWSSIMLKLAFSEDPKNFEELKAAIAKKTEVFNNEDLKKVFMESAKKIIANYLLNNDDNYSPDIKSALVPYREGLIYIEEILMEEIRRRIKKSPVKQDVEQISESDITRYEKKYNLMISQKDAEIQDLKRDLEYYEKLSSQAFRSDYSKYEEALRTLFQRMCDNKYGAPLNELYTLSLSSEDVKISDIKNIVKNLIFIFDTMEVNPYALQNVGKHINFDFDDANVIYAVNEKDIVEGMNRGILKYPGWELKGKKMILPFVVVDKEGDSDE